MNQENCISTDILNQLKSSGFPAAFLPYHFITQITEIYDDLPTRRTSTAFIENVMKRFHNHQPPDISFEPLSFLIVTYPSEPSQVVLNENGKQTTIPIPPTYLDDAEQSQKLNDVLKSAVQGYQTAHAKGISQKLLAVYSGLGKYGRNNICYTNEFGSFFNLRAYYTNIPCEDTSYPIAFLDSCESCELCKQNCPTGAIDQYPVINAEKCLTLHNENKQSFPDWIPQSSHHTLIGCLRCQEICPHNKPILAKSRHTLDLNESETQTLLSSNLEAYPIELTQKLKQFGFYEFMLPVLGRNARMALLNNHNGE